MIQTVQPISHSYWRRVAAGARAFASLPEHIKPDVKYLAAQDAAAGTITPERYAALIGEPLPGVMP